MYINSCGQKRPLFFETKQLFIIPGLGKFSKHFLAHFFSILERLKMRIDLYELSKRLKISYVNLGLYINKSEKLQSLVEWVDVEKKCKLKNGRVYKRKYQTRMVDTCDLEEFERNLNEIRYKNKKRPRVVGRELLAWTDTALICYKNNLKCEKCEQKEYCKTAFKTSLEVQMDNMYIPPLKKITLEILAKLGKPPKHLLDEV